MANKTFIINEFVDFSELVDALEALESVTYTLMTRQEDSYDSLHNKMWEHINDALQIASKIKEETK